MSLRRQIERELRQWLRSHHSVIGYHEALDVGASPGLILYKADRGEWERMHRGVYRDTATPPGPYQDLRAACVATAGFGVISHLSAAWVWRLVGQRQPPAKPDVTVRIGTRDPRGHTGLTIHRSQDLDPDLAVQRKAILVTNPLRTLVDMAACVLPQQLTEAVDSAVARQLVTIAGLQAEIERLARRGRPGVAALRRNLVDRGFLDTPPPSVLEAHTRRLVAALDLPDPAIEVHVQADGSYRLDIAWGDILLAVEVDGYAWHFSPEHMQRDVTRRNHLQQAGWTVLVYTWRQVLQEPRRVAWEITATYRRLSALG
ncbi:MAG: DUF559 domain-containing protein [Actinomycetota bacterium]|nr:DUF559 domain-containing protein [Actinomycetota bacterium]